MSSRPVVLIGEDALCLALLQRLVSHVDGGLQEFLSVVEGGSQKVRASVPRYRNACKQVPHLVLTDLDDWPCPSSLLAEWGLARSPASLIFRVAVREAESWVLADADGFASFACILAKQVPLNPEGLADPKQTLVNLARRSRNRNIRMELVPPRGSALPIGPLYNERLTGFVQTNWSPERAADAAPSLARALMRLNEFAASA